MSIHPKIVRIERVFFESACQNALAFSSAVKKRYEDASLSIPVDVKCLVWICDCAFALLQPYVSLMRKLQNDNVHVSENSKKS